MQAYLDLQLEPAFVAPLCASVLSAWVVKLHVCQDTRTVSSVLEAFAKCSSGVLCPVQLHTYVTSKAESMTQDLQRAACILCAWEAPRHKLQCSVGSRYAQRLRGQHTTMGMQLYEPTLSHLNQTL